MQTFLAKTRLNIHGKQNASYYCDLELLLFNPGLFFNSICPLIFEFFAPKYMMNIARFARFDIKKLRLFPVFQIL